MINRNREEDLLKLADEFINNLERGDCEYGGWGLDDKRPFGNSSVAYDIAEIIGISGDEELTDEEQEYCHSLYDGLGNFLRKKWNEIRKNEK
jgi:hypothetical protein